MIMFKTNQGWVNQKFIMFIFEHTQEILAHTDLRILKKKTNFKTTCDSKF